MQIPSGTTAHFIVSYDDSLGAAGAEIADAIVRTCEGDYHTISQYFGDLVPPDLPFRILVENFSWGGYHSLSTPGEIHVGVDLGPPVNPRFSQMVTVAEFVETFAIGLGAWDPGASNGEALSRVLASELYPDQLDGFATAGSWIAASQPDYVTTTDNTDGNPVSTGCGAAFLNFLGYYLAYEWRPIVLAQGGTLADTYRALTGRSDAWPRFLAAFAAYPPPRTDSDNAFSTLRVANVVDMTVAGIV